MVARTNEAGDLPLGAMYYVGRAMQMSLVTELYAERTERGVALWTVLRERDFDAMDDLYDVEQDVLERFPEANIEFRVTVESADGPSVASDETRIFSRG